MGMGVQQERLSNGLCPTCGEKAAPYYHCGKCRFTNKIRRVTRKAERLGGLVIEKSSEDRRMNLYSHKSTEAWRAGNWRDDPKENDGRYRPRLRKIPVDVEKTLIQLFHDNGNPLTEDEIFSAWGKLRTTKNGTVIQDLTNLIRAERHRKAKAERRVA